MKYWLWLTLLLGGCYEPDTITCGGQCYIADPATADIGRCRRGEWVCSATVAAGGTCIGAIGPHYELCNGIDDDCNGLVDDNPVAPLKRPCEGKLGRCGLWEGQECRDGKWICPLLPQPEVCNYQDDDCDGVIDNIKSEFCYSHPDKTTANRYPCRVGFTACSSILHWPNAHEICFGEILPQAEICDGEDNDCNGFIDDTLTTTTAPIDVVLVVDRSGSMVTFLPEVQRALRLLVAANLDIALWLWDMPGAGGQTVTAPNRECYGTNWRFPLDSCAEPALSYAIANITSVANFGGVEPSLDILEDLLTPVRNRTNWRSGSQRFVVLFADENAQTTRGLSPSDVYEAYILNTIPINVIVFTLREHEGAYRNFADLERLSEEADRLSEALSSRVTPVCE